MQDDGKTERDREREMSIAVSFILSLRKESEHVVLVVSS